MDVLIDAAAPAAPLTIEITTTPATLYAWPLEAAPPKPGLGEKLAQLAYRLFTPTVETVKLPNFGWLGPDLYRGAQPGRSGFKALQAMGIDTVINLRSESDDEGATVRALGMRYLYFPCDPLAAPSHAQTLAFLHAVTDVRLGRVYFHCYHGADRTGVFAACYRIAHDGWTEAEALRELGIYGFHHVFQQPKWQYVKAFAAYWAALGEAERNRVLRRPS